MIDFLTDNLRGSDLGRATRDKVEACQSSGALQETSDGWPYLVLPTQDGHIVDAPLGPAALEQLANERGAHVILFGLGLGHAARAVRGTGARLCFIFEPDPGVVRHYLERGPNDLSGTRILSDFAELEEAWGSLVGDVNKMQLLDTPGYAQAEPAARQQLADLVSRLLERSAVNEKTFRARGKAWISDIIENAPFMANVPSALDLQGAFRGVPAFIVGAGPSLEKNVAALAEARQKGLVFAVNASGGALDRAGVAPQILGCIESLDLSHLLGSLSYIERSVRILSLTAHPNLFRNGRGPVLSIYELLPQFARPLEQFFGRAAIPVCGSVSTAMVALAQRMGCSPIVLLGQDLAYTDGRAYSRGTAYSNNELRFASDGLTVQHLRVDKLTNDEPSAERVDRVRAWGGEGTVTSTMAFGHVRLWFERFASILGRIENPPRLINATEGGSSIAGFEEIPLAEVLRDLPDQNLEASDVVERASAKGKKVSLSDVSEFLLRQAEGARQVARAATALHETSQRASAYLGAAGPVAVRELLAELAEREKELRSVVAAWPWVDTWSWREVDDVTDGSRQQTQSGSALQGVENEAKLARVIANSAEALALRLERRAAELFGEFQASA